MAAKMDGYLSKPIRPVELDAVLEEYSQKKHREAPAVQTVPVSSTHAGDPTPIDMKELLERVDGDTAFIGELSEVFKEDYPRQMDAARSCYRDGDTQGLKRAAHGLKGALANLAAKHAMEMAASIERLAGADTLEGVQGLLDELDLELPRVLRVLAECSKEFAL